MDAGEALAPQKHNSPAKGKGRASQDAAQRHQIWSIATVDAAYEHALTETGERSVNCAEPVLWSDVVRTGAITLNTTGA